MHCMSKLHSILPSLVLFTTSILLISQQSYACGYHIEETSLSLGNLQAYYQQFGGNLATLILETDHEAAKGNDNKNEEAIHTFSNTSASDSYEWQLIFNDSPNKNNNNDFNVFILFFIIITLNIFTQTTTITTTTLLLFTILHYSTATETIVKDEDEISIDECLNDDSSSMFHAWYDGESYDFENRLWTDKTGNNNYGTIVNSTGLNIFNGSNINNDELYLNGQRIIIGTIATQITFNIELNPINHTVFNLAKYREGGVKERILSTDVDNGLFGFHDGKSGVAYEEGWITNNADSFGDEWLLSSQQNDLYRGNGQDLTLNTGYGFFTENRLKINQVEHNGVIYNEASDFALAELIVINNKLTLDEIECIEEYLAKKYLILGYTDNPTLDPTTASPTASPTTCYDDSIYTNDGYEENIDEMIMDLTFDIIINEDDEKIISSKFAQYSGKTITLQNDNKRELTCNSLISCNGANIIFKENTYCNLLCNGSHSCAHAVVSISHCDKTQIICNGQYSCQGLDIQVTSYNNDKLDILCGNRTSCNNMVIDIIGNVNSNISCIDINSCDGLSVNVESDYHQTNFLKMYSYSKNVTFSNGWGYQDIENAANATNPTTYVDCNTDNHYIKWNTSTNVSDQLFRETILSEYVNNMFPCDSLTLECSSVVNDTSTCDLDFDINSLFNITNPIQDATCYWIPVSDLINIKCFGDCVASPTEAPTSAPTQTPTQPTLEPTFNPSNDPTPSPTEQPTETTEGPTHNPTKEPSIDPTTDPTSEPTIYPSQSPTIAPTDSPSFSPSGSPTTPPSSAPTRIPTEDVDTIYDTYIIIEYGMQNLSVKNKRFLADFTSVAVTSLEYIFETNCFDAELLPFTDFWFRIYKINGIIIDNDVNHGISTNAEIEDGVIDIYDLDILNEENEAITFTAKIESDSESASIITRSSEKPTFQKNMQTDLQTYFNNTELVFSIITDTEDLEELEKFPDDDEDEESNEDLTIVMISIIIVSIGVLTSFAAFIFNKLPCTKVDNAKFLMPFLCSLGIYDFISDIYLSIQMWSNDKIKSNDINKFHIIAILTVIFILLPFAINMYFAITITSQDAINKSKSARSWFGNKLKIFILLCVLCASTYPVLGITSSRIFNIEFLNTGLLACELEELTKIKIYSTIIFENAPQVVLQLVWSYINGQFETSTILAFVASVLSIAASVFSWIAQKQNEKFIPYTYHINLVANVNKIDDESQTKIEYNKGYKKKLGEDLCKLYGIPPECIEIGFITISNNGCCINLQHSIFKTDLENIQKQYNKRMKRGMKYEYSPQMFIEDLFKEKKDEIKQCILDHFGLKEMNEIKYDVNINDDDIEGVDETYNGYGNKQRKNDDDNNGNGPNVVLSKMMKFVSSSYQSVSDNNDLDNDNDEEFKSDLELRDLYKMLQSQNKVLQSMKKEQQKMRKEITRNNKEGIEMTTMSMNRLDNRMDNGDDKLYKAGGIKNQLSTAL